MAIARKANRRTVLKAMGAGVAASTAVLGRAGAMNGRGGRGPKNVLEIIGTLDHDADEHRFELSESEIPTGWTTLNFDNQTEQTHFVWLVKLPNAEDKLSEYSGDTLREKYMNAVTLPIQNAWEPFYAGDIDVNTFIGNLVDAIPGWLITEVFPVGGPGLTAAGRDSKTTVNLTPGTYFPQCYVLNDEGVFHYANGMLESFKVTEDESPMDEPEASLNLSISTTDGIEFSPDDIELGRHTVRVTFDDNTTYGNFERHDVHLIRLDGETTYGEVNEWINWLDFDSDGYYAADGALTSTHDEPGPETFLGGVQDIDPSRAHPTAYFEVSLSPGEYAWVAEVPDPDGKGLLNRFTVIPPGRS